MAMVAVFGLTALATAYVGMAPLASSVNSPAVRNVLVMLDRTAAGAIAIGGRGTAIIACLVLGIVLILLVALNIGEGKAERVAAKTPASVGGHDPGPVWRPEPMSQDDRIANLRRRAAGLPAEASHKKPAPRPVALIRKPRERDRDWFDDLSWLGGLPRLGTTAWPCDTSGTPLPFAAQIDLAELAAACPESPLPQTGSLAFFLGTGAVVAVPEGHSEFAEAPGNLPPAYDEGGHPFPAQPGRLSRHFFPFWPVQPVAIDLPETLRTPHGEPWQYEANEKMAEQIERHARPRDTLFTAHEDTGLWWHGVNHLADQLHAAFDASGRPVALKRDSVGHAQEALAAIENEGLEADPRLEEAKEDLARKQADLAAIEAQRNGLPDMLAAIEQFIAGRDPWEPLTSDECAIVDEFLTELHANYADVVRHNVPSSVTDLAALSLRTMVTDTTEAVAALPDDQLARINREFRMPTRHPHLMFGPGSSHNPAAHAGRGDILLLQLAYDDMIEWRWGEMGLFQFWISEDDAAAGRWDRARLSFDET
ncbi:hypothetical protein GCM10011349_24640 [Novosphingobium indicum]|uniref:DUF1963 domain-containing protein n=2 Tax=Novosphingobium indicum TaxID=462949 RepID=A0ABQ2JMN0_9SPHN|nr:hypothetical protein GCM10011349_24640 [Novosphingobium indicum]